MNPVTVAHADLDALLNVVLPFAQEMLRKHGEFFPFGATMGLDGQIACRMAQSEAEEPQSAELIEILIGAFRAQADSGEVKATALCFDVRTAPPGMTEMVDAIRIGLDHRDGKAIDVLIPYSKGWFGRINYSEWYTMEAEPGIFGYPDCDLGST